MFCKLYFLQFWLCWQSCRYAKASSWLMFSYLLNIDHFWDVWVLSKISQEIFKGNLKYIIHILFFYFCMCVTLVANFQTIFWSSMGYREYDSMIGSHSLHTVNSYTLHVFFSGLVLVFAGLVTFSLEVEGFQNSLQTPLLSPAMDEVSHCWILSLWWPIQDYFWWGGGSRGKIWWA